MEFIIFIIHLSLPPLLFLLLSLYYISQFLLSLSLPPPLSSTSSFLSSLSPLSSSYISFLHLFIELHPFFKCLFLHLSLPSHFFPLLRLLMYLCVCVCFKILGIPGQKRLSESGKSFPRYV